MKLQRIDRCLVHKAHERNVLLSRVERRPGPEEIYEAEMAPDLEHPFFFEHSLDHIPAMMLVEAGRQMGIAISHLFLGVPFGTMFATQAFDIRFTEFAELDEVILIVTAVSDKRYRRDELVGLRLDGFFSQGGRQLGTMGGEWAMLRPDVWQRYRRRERLKAGA
jgi:2-oxo-3-(phosphooxy)propyl 3-oxoalkanoate synthase